MKVIFSIICILMIGSIGYAITLDGLNVSGVNIEGEFIPLVLTLGDSITNGTYQDHLQDEVGIGTYNFVGSLRATFAEGYDRDNEGHGGYRTDELEALVPGIISLDFSEASLIPNEWNIVLLHAGTNDITQSVPINDAVDNIGDIIDLFHAANSGITIYVALIIPRDDAGEEISQQYNTALNTYLETRQATEDNIIIVDMHTAFSDDTFSLCSGDWAFNCMADAHHPNDTGYQVMAKQWAACINSVTATNCNGN